jgi:hypothetical protein
MAVVKLVLPLRAGPCCVCPLLPSGLATPALPLLTDAMIGNLFVDMEGSKSVELVAQEQAVAEEATAKRVLLQAEQKKKDDEAAEAAEAAAAAAPGRARGRGRGARAGGRGGGVKRKSIGSGSRAVELYQEAGVGTDYLQSVGLVTKYLVKIDPANQAIPAYRLLFMYAALNGSVTLQPQQGDRKAKHSVKTNPCIQPFFGC